MNIYKSIVKTCRKTLVYRSIAILLAANVGFCVLFDDYLPGTFPTKIIYLMFAHLFLSFVFMLFKNAKLAILCLGLTAALCLYLKQVNAPNVLYEIFTSIPAPTEKANTYTDSN